MCLRSGASILGCGQPKILELALPRLALRIKKEEVKLFGLVSGYN